VTPLFSADGEATIRDAVRRRALLVLDFDGTLAPIVDDPAAAAMRPTTRALLRTIAMLVPCAVISGRARADVAPRVAGVPLRAIVGNHGAEPARMEAPSAIRARVRGWAAALRTELVEPGVSVEDKGFSVAVHVRRAAAPDLAQDRAARLAAGLAGARVFGGKCVVNVVPETAPTKADAVEAFAAEFPASPVLYVGDDETDEDAFRSPAVTWGVRVGRADRSAARFFLGGQEEIDALLRALTLEHRRQSS
jgi:trehalose 6-phosphate phosphatase